MVGALPIYICGGNIYVLYILVVGSVDRFLALVAMHATRVELT